MTKEEKLKLYYQAKEAYYNGQEIMTDFEFDALEKELGLENKSEVGARHNPAYTIQHPYIMGSLSKVQIHKDKNGDIDWNKYLGEVYKFINKDTWCIITPKYDGCSFEIYVHDGDIDISSRGDGEYGKDFKKHLYKLLPQKLFDLGVTDDAKEYTLRGEVLVNKKTFEEKYADEFTNPRSFVSGVLNSDYSEDRGFQNRLADLNIVIYDFRIKENDNWVDYDWQEIQTRVDGDSYFDKKSAKDIVRLLPSYNKHCFVSNVKALEEIYHVFDSHRKNCEYALDGIVIKPVSTVRENNTTEKRPKDCVAIKFIPMLEETEVLDITWNLGKTGELIPIIWVRPVEMDGRMVQKCSGHNYGYLLEKKVSIGSKIIMSLAGDIIPFLYKVTNTDNFNEDKLNLPSDTYIDGNIHLMKNLNEKEWARMKFINSASSLNIPNIGSETAKKIFDYLTASDKMTAEFFDEEEKELPYNILMVKPEEIFFGAGGGKLGTNAKKAFMEVLNNLSLVDVIKSLNFRFCGPKVAEQCAAYLLTGDADFEHLAEEGYYWVKNNGGEPMRQFNEVLGSLGRTIDDFKVIHEVAQQKASNQIPIIMTGEPNDYTSKGEFLRCHPEYRNTGSWKEVQIVFTNSMDSNTGKMKKAREKGIEIRLY